MHWYVSIVESVRVDGKPGQNNLAYVGTFWEAKLTQERSRRYYWDLFRAALDRKSRQSSGAGWRSPSPSASRL